MIKIQANDSSTLASLTHQAVASKLTHARILKEGGKRAVIVVLADAALYGKAAFEIEFGTKEPGMPFEAGKINNVSIEPVPTSEIASTARVGAAADLFDKPRRGSGFITYMDSLLLETEGEPVEGFVRSKYTVDEAVALILTKFQGRNPASVKRVAKVRPRHLERAKTSDAFSEDGTRAPRWRLMGHASGAAYINRIDALIIEGKHTPKEIANIVSHEFGRDFETSLNTVHARPSKLRAKLGADKVGLKPARATKGEKTKAEITREKNIELLKKEGKLTPDLARQAKKPIATPRQVAAKKRAAKK